MNVNQAAKLTGLPSKTLRYYEEVGLVSPARAANGYRVYDARDVQKLAFIANGRSLGFSLDKAIDPDRRRADGSYEPLSDDKKRVLYKLALRWHQVWSRDQRG